MGLEADGWVYIQTSFLIWKCKDCKSHFAIESCWDGCKWVKYSCPVCKHEHEFDDNKGYINDVIDYYSD